MLGKAAVPDDLPYVTGSIGLLGTEPSYDMMMECDTLLMIGSSFPYSEFLPEEGQARGVQIDISGRMISIRYPMEVNLVGDSAETLKLLIPLLKRKENRAWRNRIEKTCRPVVENHGSTRHGIGQSRSIRKGFSGSFLRACRITASLLAIQALRPTGMRAISKFARA